MKKTNTTENWVFLPVHKSRIIKELDKATLLAIDYDRSTILPKVFRRTKETDDCIFYSLPVDFKANIRISVRNEQTRRYEHKDTQVDIQKFVEYELDKPYEDIETGVEEQVGNSVEPVEE